MMIDQDMKDLKKLGVRYTPSFFVNGKALGNFGLLPLKELIEEEISKNY